ncbi:MAG: M3 family oligoendopeptidase [Chloroflexi bacterium]|nr:M3 family oligoendopeptidase [Chloroflexota bacterium]
MTLNLPATPKEFMRMSWKEIEPFYHELNERQLSSLNVEAWLTDWTRLSELVNETQQRLYVATAVNTEDKDAEQRLFHFLDYINPPVESAEQNLRQKLLASGLEPAGFAVPLRNMRTQAALFREKNLPLLTEEHKLENEYDKIAGAQMVEWEGRMTTVTQLKPVYQSPDRVIREKAWQLAAARQLADREAINHLWMRFMSLRGQLAANAGFPDYRAFRWKQLLRFDYTPADCVTFQDAIERVAVPAAQRIYERRRQQLDLAALRPWDLNVDPFGRPALKPFATQEELEDKTESIFNRINPQLGDYFAIMRKESLLDLDNRKAKAPGGFCTSFASVKRPFIFMNAVGLHDDVQTLLHEGGHAFHVFESVQLPYAQQLDVGMEFAEVASMSMELLGMPYLAPSGESFYNESDAARALVEHLESLILFWPYMAVVDAFQHWVYENHQAASDPAHCDRIWANLWNRFMRGIDWSGLEQEMTTGWQRKLHIHHVPFYYVEYGMAQLGAVQVWRNAQRDQNAAVKAYRRALSLGGSVTLPELFAAAGAKFSFDETTLADAVSLIESTLDSLSGS